MGDALRPEESSVTLHPSNLTALNKPIRETPGLSAQIRPLNAQIERPDLR
jgi:hypothetical protein